jgi:hypothetical protein
MPGVWHTDDVDFDTAADRFLAAHGNDGRARDVPVLDLRTWGVKPDGEHFALHPIGHASVPLPLRANALSNVCGRLQAPTDFIRRLPAPLQLANLNYCLAAVERPVAVSLRMRGKEVAAVVSERYAPLDPVELITTLREALTVHGVLHEARVRAVATGLVDVLRITLPSEQVAVKVGDVSHVGIDVSSSCFGRSALHVRGILFRLKCTNGLRVGQEMGSFSFRHIGETERLRSALLEAVPTALAHARGVFTQWRRAIGVFISDLSEVINGMRELTLGERQRVGQELKGELGVAELPERTSVFDFVNGITAAARESEPARRIELETLAGDVLRREMRGRS